MILISLTWELWPASGQRLIAAEETGAYPFLIFYVHSLSSSILFLFITLVVRRSEP